MITYVDPLRHSKKMSPLSASLPSRLVGCASLTSASALKAVRHCHICAISCPPCDEANTCKPGRVHRDSSHPTTAVLVMDREFLVNSVLHMRHRFQDQQAIDSAEERKGEPAQVEHTGTHPACMLDTWTPRDDDSV